MKRALRIPPLLLLILVSLLTAALAQEPTDPLLKALEKDYKPLESLLPEGVRMAEAFKESGAPKIGLVDFVQNMAYLIHKDDPGVAYKLVKSLPLCAGDLVITEEKSSATLLLNDQSRISMNSYSKLALDKSVYNPQESFRDTALRLFIGKARFVAAKVASAFGASNNFQVDTPLGSCGVRGSDFVVALVPEDALAAKQSGLLEFFSFASPAYAQGGLSLLVLAGPNTTLSLQGLTGPPVIMTSFTVSQVTGAQPPTPPVPVSPSQTPQLFNRLAPGISVMGMPDFLE